MLLERAGEGALLLLLLLAPLPFGSVQKGASFVVVAWVAAMAWIVLTSKETADSPLARIRWALALGIGMGIGVLQAIPLPRALVAALSPAAARLYGSIPEPSPAVWLPLSLRPAASLELAGRIAAYGAVFAVAAALAAQAFGPPAATVSAVYGVLMLLLGAAAAQLLIRRRSSAPASPSAGPS